MPKCFKNVLSVLVVAPLLTAALAQTAHADTYKLYTVAYTQSEDFVMGDDFGDYAFNSSVAFGHTNLCGTSYLDICYLVGNAITGITHYSSSLPSPTADPDPKAGTTTRPSGPGWDPTRNLGNLSSGYYQLPAGQLIRGIWDGSDPVADFLSDGTIDGGLTSGNGNVFYTDGYHNTLVVAIDQQTSPVPEPGTFSLTASAVLGAAGLLKRRFRP